MSESSLWGFGSSANRRYTAMSAQSGPPVHTCPGLGGLTGAKLSFFFQCFAGTCILGVIFTRLSTLELLYQVNFPDAGSVKFILSHLERGKEMREQ